MTGRQRYWERRGRFRLRGFALRSGGLDAGRCTSCLASMLIRVRSDHAWISVWRRCEACGHAEGYNALKHFYGRTA